MRRRRNEQCKTCAYEEKGRCHRHPPIVFTAMGGVKTAFPEVDGRDWCGEYEPKEPDS